MLPECNPKHPVPPPGVRCHDWTPKTYQTNTKITSVFRFSPGNVYWDVLLVLRINGLEVFGCQQPGFMEFTSSSWDFPFHLIWWMFYVFFVGKSVGFFAPDPRKKKNCSFPLNPSCFIGILIIFIMVYYNETYPTKSPENKSLNFSGFL